MNKLAIVGSRNWPDKQAVVALVNRLHHTTVVISGGARGVDTWAIEAARARGLQTIVIPADWKRHGRSAGYRRNFQIVEQADGMVAFCYQCSAAPGTQSAALRKKPFG